MLTSLALFYILNTCTSRKSPTAPLLRPSSFASLSAITARLRTAPLPTSLPGLACALRLCAASFAVNSMPLPCPNPPPGRSSVSCTPSNKWQTTSVFLPPSASPNLANSPCSWSCPASAIRVRVCRPFVGLAITPSLKCSVWASSTKKTFTTLWTIFAPARRKSRKLSFASIYDRNGAPRSLVLYDVTSSYLEGEHNALGEFGYNRDGKKGKLQIVIGLLADPSGEPLAVRVFSGNTGDPSTVAEQIDALTKQFAIKEVIFVGDRGMVKKAGKQALGEAGFRYISALTDPQIRNRLAKGTWQLDLFAEQVCEVEADGVRYVPVSYTHLRAHETRHDLVCRLLLEKKKKQKQKQEGVG